MSSPSEPVELEHGWTIYYDEKKKRGVDYATFQKQMKTLGAFHTIQEFWRFWNNIALKSLPTGSNVRVFKQHIQPAWEDENNARGGKWVIELPPRESEKCTMVLLNLIGEQFTHSDTMCGLVFSIRAKSNLLLLWNSDAHASPEYYKTTEEEICKILNESGSKISVSYKPHKTAKRKSRSNRNSEEEDSLTTMNGVLNGDTGKRRNPSISVPELQVNGFSSNESSSDETSLNSSTNRKRAAKKTLTVPLKRTHSRSSSDDFKGRTRRHGKRLSYSQEYPRSPESQRRALRRSSSSTRREMQAEKLSLGFVFWYLIAFFSAMFITVVGHAIFVSIQGTP